MYSSIYRIHLSSFLHLCQVLTANFKNYPIYIKRKETKNTFYPLFLRTVFWLLFPWVLLGFCFHSDRVVRISAGSSVTVKQIFIVSCRWTKSLINGEVIISWLCTSWSLLSLLVCVNWKNVVICWLDYFRINCPYSG